MNKWTAGHFSSDLKSTVGANHQRKTVFIGKDEVELYLWDTAGQEQFQALTPLYVRNATTALITAAIDDSNSFDTLQTWIDLINSACFMQAAHSAYQFSKTFSVPNVMKDSNTQEHSCC